MSFEFTATRGQQGGKTYFVANVTFGALSRVLAIDTGDVMERSQREVEKPRAANIQAYLNTNRESYVLPALTGIVEDPELEFEELGHAGSNVGYLKLSLDAEIKLFDGQHRATGIRQVMKQNNYLKNDQIALQLFVGMDLQQRQQAFSDINSNAKSVSKSLNMAYSHRDDNVRPLVRAIDKIQSWKGRIDFENNTVPKDSEKLFALRNIVQACRTVKGVGKREMLVDLVYLSLQSFWDDVGTAVGWITWKNGPEQTPRSVGLQNENVFFTVAGLMVLARLGNKIEALPAGVRTAAKQHLVTVLRETRPSRHNWIWKGNIVKDNGNMDASITAQAAAADKIFELVTAKLRTAQND